MIHIDRKYLLLISPRLQNFVQKNTNLYSFRCPFCGDSKKNKLKSRGYVYEKSNQYYYSCFNCSLKLSLRKLITALDPALEKEYVLENYANKHTYNTPKIAFKHRIPIFNTNTPPATATYPSLDLPSIQSLPPDHPAYAYVLSRQIPPSAHHLLYYTPNFSQYAQTLNKKIKDSNPRLIIPFFDQRHNLIAIQGRSLDPNNPIRYITIKIKPTLKLYGLERINPNQTIQVVEGPLDSLFLNNCIATADSNLTTPSTLFSKHQLVLIPDNQPRNPEIVKNIQNYIDQNYAVCLFPDSINQKDINLMIQAGYTQQQIQTLIDAHTYTGLRAKLEFVHWKKV